MTGRIQFICINLFAAFYFCWSTGCCYEHWSRSGRIDILWVFRQLILRYIACNYKSVLTVKLANFDVDQRRVSASKISGSEKRYKRIIDGGGGNYTPVSLVWRHSPNTFYFTGRFVPFRSHNLIIQSFSISLRFHITKKLQKNFFLTNRMV